MFIGFLFLPALNDKLNGNILTYNESEDAYYIQNGADAVPKKLQGNSMLEFVKIASYSNNVNTFSANNGMEYKAIFVSFWYKTTGNYGFTFTGCKKVLDYADNDHGTYLHRSGIFIPTQDDITIHGYGSMHVFGVK